MTARIDARPKATGAARFTADHLPPGCLHLAFVRSTVPSAKLVAIDAKNARASDGVVAVFTAADLPQVLLGRECRDVPLLSTDRIRFVGERIAAVVATSRTAAERAARLVIVEDQQLAAVTDARTALAANSPAVHERPWDYPFSYTTAEELPNVQLRVAHGSMDRIEAALASAAYVVDESYSTPGGHQGYLEPHASIVWPHEDGTVEVWATNKGPFSLRDQLATAFDLPPESIVVHAGLVGGDFGGKGAANDTAVLFAVARALGRPVKWEMRFDDDLVATNPRHPAWIRVRLGANADGSFVAMAIVGVLDGGAYAGFKLRGGIARAVSTGGRAYRIPLVAADVAIAYTNTVPRGHARAPGDPQVVFAVESAVDEMAFRVGIDPIDLRRRNLLRTGDRDPTGNRWRDVRTVEALEAVVEASQPIEPPPGWLHGVGVGVYRRGVTSGPSSFRVTPLADGRVHVGIAVAENGAGALDVARRLVATELCLRPTDVAIDQLSTTDLPIGPAATGSRITHTLHLGVKRLGEAWRSRRDDAPFEVDVNADEIGAPTDVAASCAQLAQVAVDPRTGQVKVLEIVTSVDVGVVINDAAHRAQLDGGMVMGFGFALLEDLVESDGQIWAGVLGEFRLPSSADTPLHRIVIVPTPPGCSPIVKPVGELANTPTAAAIANAVAAATGRRIRRLPLTAERVYGAVHQPETSL